MKRLKKSKGKEKRSVLNNKNQIAAPTLVARRKSSIPFIPAILIAVLYIVCVICTVVNSSPEKYDYIVGQLSDKTVSATRSIEDTYSAQLLREEEMAKVQPRYNNDNAVTEECINRIHEDFLVAEQLRSSAKSRYITANPATANTFVASRIDWETVLTAEDMYVLRASVPEYMDDQCIYTIASMEADKLTMLRDALEERVRIRMKEEGILADDLENALQTIKSELLVSGSFFSKQADLAYTIMKNNVKPNLTFDSAATDIAKRAAADAVVPTVYKEGQVIVQKGYIITKAQYELIKELGLTSDDSTYTKRLIMSFLLFFVLFGAATLYATIADRSIIETTKSSLSIFLLTLLGIILAIVCKGVDENLRLNLVFLPSIIGAVLFRRRTALAYGVFMSVMTAFLMAPNTGFFFDPLVLRTLMGGMFGSVGAVLLLRKKQHRGEYILAGLLAGGINSVVIIVHGISSDYLITDYIASVGYGMAGGLISGLLSVGVLPIWEAMFSLATPLKLLELANPGNELLKRLMIEAPGTYHHSIMVANLSEAGAAAVGADELLARVSAYYHDIGKLRNPTMFKENQLHIKNPHDELRPNVSAQLIISHIPDGIELAEKYNLPERIRDIIKEHQGTTLTSYFYHLAKQSGGEVDESKYRYPGPKPGTKEAGVVMLADVTEAAVRANGSVQNGTLNETIAKLIKSKYDDGQLDNCPLNRLDLKRIQSAFVYVLEGAHHERIVYPEDDN